MLSRVLERDRVLAGGKARSLVVQSPTPECLSFFISFFLSFFLSFSGGGSESNFLCTISEINPTSLCLVLPPSQLVLVPKRS